MTEVMTLQQLSQSMGVSVGMMIFLAIVQVWSLVWKALACWKSARRGEWIWFVALFIINTFGILEILYIFLFSKMKIFNQKKEEKSEIKTFKKKK